MFELKLVLCMGKVCKYGMILVLDTVTHNCFTHMILHVKDKCVKGSAAMFQGTFSFGKNVVLRFSGRGFVLCLS